MRYNNGCGVKDPETMAYCSLIGLYLSALTIAGGEPTVDFNRDIRPILSSKCFACHGPDEEHREADFRLDDRDSAVATLESGVAPIVPGAADRSEVIARVTATDESLRMPPAGKDVPLTPAEVDKLRRWIDAGASYAKHWSLVAPTRPALTDTPSPRADSLVDVFIEKKLHEEGLAPAPEADRYLLLRRLSLDLVGLPPTIAESDAFAADARPDAHERVIDRLLAAPAFGERWASVWLDLARYADSTGYASDPLRRTIWRYRDWLIDALNRNLPFDEFTVEQLAGDMLPGARADQILATAFHRNTMTNTEGGTDDEEWRVAAVKDRATTTFQVWMGLTLGCAQCHTHKYDPLTQREYYQLYAFFNQTADSDKGDDQPLASMPTAEMEEKTRAIEAQVEELRDKLVRSPALAEEQAAWETSLAYSGGWTVLAPDQVTASAGTQFERLEDGSVLARGEASVPETYTIEGMIPSGGLTALRLEAIPDPSLPAQGPGRAPDGNFVLSHITVDTGTDENADGPVRGRFIRIELPGNNRILSLAEVEAFSEGANVATRGAASQSSTEYDAPASRAIDGTTDGDFFGHSSVTHTAHENHPWWEVDLGAEIYLERIAVHNRTDGGTGGRMAGAVVQIRDQNREVIWEQVLAEAPAPSTSLSVDGWRSAPIASASASYAQEGFAAASAVSQPDLKASGWAIAPKIGEAHTAWFMFSRPTPNTSPARIRIRLEHHYPTAGFALGRFRLSVTADESALRRASVPPAFLAIVDRPDAERSPADRERLAAYFHSIAPSLAPIRAQIAELEKSKPTGPMVPVMRELPPKEHRKTFLMQKGNFLVPGEEVESGIPAALHPWPAEAPMNRLGLARWITAQDNPLTARVTVNRLWARLLGRGIVETEEDFGVQGDWPTHPQLLDGLAVDLVDRDWDIKRILRVMVTSATYRQSSRVTPQSAEKDPANRLLAHAPRRRLNAEQVRDQALFLSGVLSTKMLGESVYPYQPPGLWQAAFNGSDRNWTLSPGEDRFRRGLYTFWRRTIPYPSMAAFDAPSREVCTLRRPATNTPLQVFVTWNDPVYVELAQALGRRLAREAGPETRARVELGLRLCLGRPADEASIETLVRMYDDQLTLMRENGAETNALATEPIGPLPPGMEPAEGAALTVLGSVLLNLDGVLTKG